MTRVRVQWHLYKQKRGNTENCIRTLAFFPFLSSGFLHFFIYSPLASSTPILSCILIGHSPAIHSIHHCLGSRNPSSPCTRKRICVLSSAKRNAGEKKGKSIEQALWSSLSFYMRSKLPHFDSNYIPRFTCFLLRVLQHPLFITWYRVLHGRAYITHYNQQVFA